MIRLKHKELTNVKGESKETQSKNGEKTSMINDARINYETEKRVNKDLNRL
jgi:hypothetical protein